MKGYKAFHEGWKCRNDFQYEVGKTYTLPEDQKLEMCARGFHFCKNLVDVFGYYDKPVIIAEVEALGEIQQEGTKFVTDKIKIVREIDRDDFDDLWVRAKTVNSGNYNTGRWNSGDFNSGCYNAGDYNSGRDNTGDCNSGNGNTGHYNSGHRNTGQGNRGNYNTGHCNSGNGNTGHYNSGHRNTGEGNRGNYNTGHWNSGGCNTGSYNSGDNNVGSFNSGNCNVGFFNTDTPKARLFNKECDFTPIELRASLDYDLSDLLNRIHAAKLEPEDISRIKALPNFDPAIFKEIVGYELPKEEKDE